MFTHNSPTRCFSLIKAILQCHPFWPSHSEDRQTPTHLFRFPSLVFSVLSVNKFRVFSGQQDEGISLRACSGKEMLSLIANSHDSTQLTDYRTWGTASFWGSPPCVPPKHYEVCTQCISVQGYMNRREWVMGTPKLLEWLYLTILFKQFPGQILLPLSWWVPNVWIPTLVREN